MRLIRQHKAGLGPRPSSAQPFLGSQPDEEPIPLQGVWARPPPPPALPAESSAPAESDDESMSVACSATVESFEDFFQDPDGSGARVAAAVIVDLVVDADHIAPSILRLVLGGCTAPQKGTEPALRGVSPWRKNASA